MIDALVDRLLDALPPRFKRLSFWLVVSLLGNAVLWLFILNHDASLSRNARQTLFGMNLSYGFSTNLALLELASIPFFALMLLVVAFRALARWRRSPPPPIGLCRSCGYDLRATPLRCPECGAVPLTPRRV